MKKNGWMGFFLACLVLILAMPVEANRRGPRWVLYDNFDSNQIDREKWDLDDSSAEVTAQGGMARFVHNTGKPLDSSWLIFRKSPEKIKAIRAKVRIEADTKGDVRARIGGWLGQTVDSKPVFLGAELRPEKSWADCSAVALSDTSGTQWLYDLFYAQMGKPEGVAGTWYTIEIHFNRSLFMAYGSAFGSIVHIFQERVLPLDNAFKGIGTRNAYAPDSPEECIVWFDDVYVLY
jgi:hypothetical protein